MKKHPYNQFSHYGKYKYCTNALYNVHTANRHLTLRNGAQRRTKLSFSRTGHYVSIGAAVVGKRTCLVTKGH